MPRWAALPRPVQNGHRLTLPSPGASEAVTSADRARVPHAPCLSLARGGARGLVEGFLWLEAAANTCFCSQVSFVETASQGRRRLCSPETLNSTEEPARAPAPCRAGCLGMAVSLSPLTSHLLGQKHMSSHLLVSLADQVPRGLRSGSGLGLRCGTGDRFGCPWLLGALPESLSSCSPPRRQGTGGLVGSVFCADPQAGESLRPRSRASGRGRVRG